MTNLINCLQDQMAYWIGYMSAWNLKHNPRQTQRFTQQSIKGMQAFYTHEAKRK